MKKDRKKAFTERLGEAAIEIVVSVIFFGVGALIVYLFGGDPFGEHADFDGIALIGIVALVLVAAGIGWIVHLTRKKRHKQTREEQPAEEIETVDLRIESRENENRLDG